MVNLQPFRKHEFLGDKTPAQKAGIKLSYKDWQDVVRGEKLEKVLQDTSKEIAHKAHIPRASPTLVPYRRKRSRKVKPKRRQPFKRTEISLKEIRV